MSKRSITSYDIAKEAGVSQSAVSRAFTPGGKIAKKTRQHILEVARKMDYQPNAIARSMSTARTSARQKSGMVGIIVTRLQDPFFSRIIDMFSRSLQAKGWHVLLFTVEQPSEVDNALHELMQFKIDGVLILSAILSEHMAQTCRDQGTPVILYNRETQNKEINSVRIDNISGGRIAAEVLLEAGHKKIAFIGGSQTEATTDDRERGFTDRLAEDGIDLMRRELGNYTFESGHEAARRILSRQDRPNAIFCASDVMALGVLHSARHDFNLKIPEDLSLIGFDDIPSVAWPDHQLTTIRQPVTRMVRKTVDILVERMENPEMGPENTLFQGELILRNSVKNTNPA